MKRTLITLLVVALLVTLGASSYVAQDGNSVTFGVITYQVDHLAMPTDKLGGPGRLEGDINILPLKGRFGESAGGVLETPAVALQPEVSLVIRDAGTVEAQIAALEELRAMGVDGIVLTPVPEVAALQDAVEATIQAGIPVVFTYRDIPGIRNTAFVGVEPFALGNAWGRGWMALSAPQPPLNGDEAFGHRAEEDLVAVFATSLDDPLQKNIAAGFAGAVGEHLVSTVVTDNPLAAAQELISDNPELVSFAVLDHSLIAGVVEAVIASERKITVGVFGAPEDFGALTQQKRIKGNVQPDYYPMLLEGLVSLKVHVVDGTPLMDNFLPVMWMGTGAIGGGLPSYVRFPYESERQFGFLWYWWFG